MQTEVEAKFLHVDHEKLRKQLRALGAELVHSVRVMRRVNMDFSDNRLDDIHGWLRIRDEGNKVTLTYKQVDSWDIQGMKEVETVVSDFTATQQVFEAIGLHVKSSIESKRETWQLDGAEVVLDEWPWVDPFFEIEAADETKVKDIAARLGFDWNDALFGSVEPVYRAQYDITDPEFYTIADFGFDQPLPELLKSRKRPVAVNPMTTNVTDSKVKA
jgi:adenylate cyclase class 2